MTVYSLITRRSFCVSAALPFVIPAAHASASPNQMMADIAHFARMGEHRAGSDTENRTAGWIASRLQALGYSSRIDSFPIVTFSNPHAIINVEGTSFTGFVQWRSPIQTWPATLYGKLATAVGDSMYQGSIVVQSQAATLSAYWPEALDAELVKAREAGAAAVVLAVDDPSSGLFVYNRHAELPPLALPVILLAKRDLPKIAALAQSGSAASLSVYGSDILAAARNVIASKPGTGKAIVLSTPLTGWFRCGAERGPGIALLLALAGNLQHSGRPVFLFGTGAHEIGHLGMHRALKSDAPKLADVGVWCHLGAGIAATAQDLSFRLTSPHYVIATAAMKDAVSQLVASGLIPIVGNPAAPGETGQVIAHGYSNVIGMAGVFPAFHTPEDDGSAVDPDRLLFIRKLLAHLLLGRL